MKLIINATELSSTLATIRAIGARLPMGAEEMLRFMEDTSDIKRQLAKDIAEPRHGVSIVIADGKTLEAADLTEISYVVEIPEADIIAVNDLIIRHSGMIVAIFKMYHTAMELMGEFAMSFSRDLKELAKSKFNFGKRIDGETTAKKTRAPGRRTAKAAAK